VTISIKLPSKLKLLHAVFALVSVFGLAAIFLLGYIFLYLKPNLPSLEAVTVYQPKIPLRIYTADHVLIGEFGEERRNFVPIGQIPRSLKHALLAAEDDQFYQHGGVDFSGVLRAALVNLRGGSMQGGSTITMQVARNFFLTREKTLTRKINEVMLAYKIEASLSKDKILELYMNQIYLGQRAYGFDTAANIYFGKSVKDITIAQAAMLAGLPKAPSAYNPVVNPKRATLRQHHILKRMRTLDYITQAQYDQAMKEPLQVRVRTQEFDVHAEYAAEMVRQAMYEQYKEETYTRGFNVYTTLFKADQEAAYRAVRRGVMDYERRHGYRGPEAFIDLPADEEARQEAIDDVLTRHAGSGELRSAVVTAASSKSVRAEMLSGETISITGEGLRFAASALSRSARATLRIRPGAVIRVTQDAKGRWSITQLPQVEAALVAINAHDGSYRAMVGGFDFNLNKFDRTRQAWRQPGSSLKPFIYSAALEKGFSPGTLIQDAPLVIEAAFNGGQVWEPKNDTGNYDGPISMRTGLVQSKNVVSVRILREIGPEYARTHLSRFGFEPDRHPANLSMALGTGAVTPLQLAGAYAVFANGGYQVNPYLIQKITDSRGTVLAEATPVQAGQEEVRVLDPRNAFAVDSMLRDVTRSGTAAAATQKLGRMDLAGKTGTTNDSVDGWFAGYSGEVVAVAWMGYDEPRSLGSREFGSTLGLPIWIDYMRAARRGAPVRQPAVPAGLVQVEGDWMYQEFAEGGAVRSVDVDEMPWPFRWKFPVPTIEDEPRQQEKKRMQDLYFGSNRHGANDYATG
jgi:penicillin-binding protein 1A